MIVASSVRFMKPTRHAWLNLPLVGSCDGTRRRCLADDNGGGPTITPATIHKVIALVVLCLVYLIYSSTWHVVTQPVHVSVSTDGLYRSVAAGNTRRKPALRQLNPSMLELLRKPSTASLTSSLQPYKLYIPGSGGRFGNQMFEYASAYGIARMNNRSAVTHATKFDQLRATFAGLSIPAGDPPPRMKTITHLKARTYDPKFENLPNCNVQLNGYFASWRFFMKYERELRKEFTLKGTLRKHATRFLRRIAAMQHKNITYVGVHVRRGDKVQSTSYVVASKSYITRAMNDFRSNFTRVHFIVCSDDITWCKENLREEKNVSFSESRSVIMDFAILSLCNHTLATVGSFSWWAGWLAGGVTTYCKNFANTSSDNYKNIKITDHFLPNWIPLSD